MKKVTHALLLFFAVSCGQDEVGYLSLTIRSVELRRFPPGEPSPDFVNVRVLRSDRLLGAPVINLDLPWKELQPDTQTGKRRLEIAIEANRNRDFDYLVRLSSILVTEEGGLAADECGVAAFIKVGAGEYTPVEIVVHPGECSRLLCQVRSDCVGEQRFCLSFECYDWQLCGHCPQGAGCDSLGFCTGECTDDNSCTTGLRCCRGTCSRNCPDW